jgi:hypothetical protein
VKTDLEDLVCSDLLSVEISDSVIVTYTYDLSMINKSNLQSKLPSLATQNRDNKLT